MTWCQGQRRKKYEVNRLYTLPAQHKWVTECVGKVGKRDKARGGVQRNGGCEKELVRGEGMSVVQT